MKIALIQSEIEYENKEENLRRAEAVIREEASLGMDLILFPEMSFTGFSMRVEKIGEEARVVDAEAGIEIEGRTLQHLRELAVAYRVAIGFGWVALPRVTEKESTDTEVAAGTAEEASDTRSVGHKAENRYTILDKTGHIISTFTKLHPFSYAGEDRFFRGGEGPLKYTVAGIPFTTMICYDLRFPEEFRVVAPDVHAALIPANWPASRAEHWKTLLRARAIENQIYIFAVNCAGHMAGQYYSGDSCIIRPDGQVVQSLTGEAGVLRYEFNDDTEDFRAKFPVLQDMRH